MSESTSNPQQDLQKQQPQQGSHRYLDNQRNEMNEMDMMYQIYTAVRSIRGMLQFFVVLVILGIVVQACNVLLSVGR